MNTRTTNFFEISVTPPIKQLYVTENYRNQRLDFSGNVHVPLTKDSIVSLFPFETSKIIASEPQHIEWLFKKLLFQAFERSKAFFDLNYRGSELTILEDRLSQRKEYSILRRLVFRVFHSHDKLLLAFDPFARIYNRLTLDTLLSSYEFTQEYFLMQNNCLVFIEQGGDRKWVRGRIRQLGSIVKVEVPYLLDGTLELTPARIIPSLDKRGLAKLLKTSTPKVDLDKEVKALSAMTSSAKIQTIQQVFEKYISGLFHLQVRDVRFDISMSPLDG